MDQATLVDREIDAGSRLVEELLRADFPISTAFWMFREDSGEYRLVLASSFVERHGPNRAYERIAETLASGGFGETLPLHRIEAVGPNDRLASAVRRLVRTYGRGTTGIRLTNNLMNGVLIPDAYVYRAA